MTSTHVREKRAATKVTDERVFTRWDYLVYCDLTLVVIVAIIYLLVRWFSYGDLTRHPVLFLCMTLGLGLSLVLYLGRWLTLPFIRRPRPMLPATTWRVGVATTYVPGAESLDMLAQTVAALVAMDYPHEVWVLDEGDDSQVERLCRLLGAWHYTRKHKPEYQTAEGKFEARSKHGNYNAWLDEIGFGRYDLIANFDPDHVPRRDFLVRLLGYFEDERIGYAQAPQVYYNKRASFIARGAAEETYAYYSSVQMAKYAMGFPIVTGCHTVHRVTALRQVGGFAPHEADDLLITLHYRAAGWRGVYVPEILAKGLTPVDWVGYLGQQRRWARSVLDVRMRHYPRLMAQFPLMPRVASQVHGVYYLHGAAVAVQIVSLVVMLATGLTLHVLSLSFIPSLLLVMGVLQLCDLYRQRYFLGRKDEWGVQWRPLVLQWAKWPWFLVALYDVLTQRRGPYNITRKAGAATRRHPLTLPHLTVALVIAAAWAVGILLQHTVSVVVYAGAAVNILASLATVASGYLPFPDPYDADLAGRALGTFRERA